MSKRDIKAKRWLRKEMKRNYRAAWDWAKSTTGTIKAIASPVSATTEERMLFLTQVRMFGDGRWQYREWVLLRRFSLKLRRLGLNRQEWRDC